jgi:hypothetical protein
MTQTASLMLLVGHDALAKHQAEWDSLLARYDPKWMAVTIQLRRLIQHVQSADKAEVERAQTPTPETSNRGNTSSASSAT